MQSRQRGDFVYFHHVMKTGGTTLSNVLQRGLGEEHLVPGSRESGTFQKADLIEAVQQNPWLLNGTTSTLWSAFAHTPDPWYVSTMNKNIPGFQSQYSWPSYADESALSGYYSCHFGRSKRKASCVTMSRAPPAPHNSPVFHLLKLVRHPVYHVASRYAEQLCGLQRKHGGKWCEVDLAQEAAKRSEERVRQCMLEDGGHNPRKHEKECKAMEAKQVPDKCDGTDVFMDEADVPGTVGGLSRGVCDEDTETRPDAAAAYSECYSRMVNMLRSYLLVGVTERMHETSCLLSYYLAVPYVKEGTSRHKPCRPINVWTPTAKDRLIHASRRGWAIYDAANTVLDERMAAATRHLQQLVREGVPIELLPHIGSGCFNVTLSQDTAQPQTLTSH